MSAEIPVSNAPVASHGTPVLNPPRGESAKWTEASTRVLIDVYKSYLPQKTSDGDYKKNTWTDMLRDINENVIHICCFYYV